jgi:hypothetical protein
MTNYHYGDRITQYGNFNVGKAELASDPQAALRELFRVIAVMRGEAPESDREVIDRSLETVAAGDKVSKADFRQALRDIAGIAATVGQVGVPVIDAIRSVLTAIGR